MLSYQEKKTITGIVAGLLVLAGYIIYVFGGQRSDPQDLRFYAISMLIFVGIGVAVTIVLQIVFHIMLSVSVAIRERGCDDEKIKKAVEAAVVEDEMDRLIELKTMRVGFVICGAGFFVGLVTVALKGTAVFMINILFLSFYIGTLAADALRLYYYRAGVKNGR